jgi:hypothetical protein
MWQPTPYVFTPELGEPCDPRNALPALKAAAKRAGLPSSVGLHTPWHSAHAAQRPPPANTLLAKTITGRHKRTWENP